MMLQTEYRQFKSNTLAIDSFQTLLNSVKALRCHTANEPLCSFNISTWTIIKHGRNNSVILLQSMAAEGNDFSVWSVIHEMLHFACREQYKCHRVWIRMFSS